jgi:hypothetical protein
MVDRSAVIVAGFLPEMITAGTVMEKRIDHVKDSTLFDVFAPEGRAC